AAYSDTADYLSVNRDRHSALQWREVSIRQSNHRRAAILDDVFERFGRTFEKHGCACFADRDIRARCKRAIEAFQSHQVAAFIDDGDEGGNLMALERLDGTFAEPS